MEARTFASAQEFLDFEFSDRDACMIVDIKMQGMSGLELQEELRAKGFDLPVIFITGFDSPETREQAKKSGAAGYFRKPMDDQALMDSIQWAFAKSMSTENRSRRVSSSSIALSNQSNLLALIYCSVIDHPCK